MRPIQFFGAPIAKQIEIGAQIINIRQMDSRASLTELIKDLKNTPELCHLGYNILQNYYNGSLVLYIIDDHRKISTIQTCSSIAHPGRFFIRGGGADVFQSNVGEIKELLKEIIRAPKRVSDEEIFYLENFPNLAAKQDFYRHRFSRDIRIQDDKEMLWCFQYWENCAMAEKLEKVLCGHPLPTPIKQAIIG